MSKRSPPAPNTRMDKNLSVRRARGAKTKAVEALNAERSDSGSDSPVASKRRRAILMNSDSDSDAEECSRVPQNRTPVTKSTAAVTKTSSLKPGQQPNFVANPGHPGDAPLGYDRTLGGLLCTEANGLPLLTSITVGVRKQHCPKSFHPLTFQCLTVLADVAAACLETGKRKGFAHVQATALFYVDGAFEDALVAINNALKQWCGIAHGSGGVVQVKLAQGSQTKNGLIGYVHKLPIKASLWNITEAELEAAKEEYALVSTDPLAGKRNLNKSNFVKEIYAFAVRNFPADMPEIDIAALQAIRTGEYAPVSTWLAGSGGAGIDLERSRIYWRLFREPEKATVEDIHAIFFHNPYRRQKLPVPRNVPSFAEMKRRQEQRAMDDTEHFYSKHNVVHQMSDADEDDEELDLQNRPGSHHYMSARDDPPKSPSLQESATDAVPECEYIDDQAEAN